MLENQEVIARGMREISIEAEILTLKEAATLSRIAQNTLREMIKNRVIRASKIGRGYKLFKQDLLQDLKELYGKKRVRDSITKEVKWESTSGQVVNSGLYASRVQADEEYKFLLARKASKKPKDCTIR